MDLEFSKRGKYSYQRDRPEGALGKNLVITFKMWQ